MIRSTHRLVLTLTILAFCYAISAVSPTTIRSAYREIALEHLPTTAAYLNGKEDNVENRDQILTYHNPDRELITVGYKGAPYLATLKLYTGGQRYYVAIEHSKCRSKKCDNKFVILQKKSDNYIDVTSELLTDVDMKLDKIRSTVKKEYKKSYGDNDAFESAGLDEDEALLKHLRWEIDIQTGEILFKETALPIMLGSYTWDESKSKFVKS